MGTIGQDHVKESDQSNRSKSFDQLDKMPDISLRELYYVLKASRRKLKEKYQNKNVDTELSSI